MKKKLYFPIILLVLIVAAPLWLPYLGVYDQILLEKAISIRTPFLNSFFKTITHLGDTSIVLALLFVGTLFLYKKGKLRDAKMIAASSILGIGSNFLIKDFVGRTRPYSGFSLVSESSYSYPSAHATIAITLYFFLLSCIAPLIQNKMLRGIFWTASLFLPLSLALSRVYLGVHFPTDIVAGALLGLLSIYFCKSSFRKI